MKTILLLPLLFLIGCSTPGPIFQQATMTEGVGLLYIYRPHSTLHSTKNLTVSINGERKGRLSNKTYMALSLQPGKYRVKVGKMPLTTEVVAGRSLYVRFKYVGGPSALLDYERGQLRQIKDESVVMREIANITLVGQ